MDETRYALHVTQNDPKGFGKDYLRLAAHVVTVAEDDTPRNLMTSDRDPLAGITATAQADRDPWDGGASFSYGWRFGLASDVDPIPAEQLARSLAVLRKVERAMAAADARYGRPLTFGAYLARIADALRIPIMTGRSGSDGMYTSGTFHEWRPGDAVSVIDGWVATFRANV